MICTPIGRPDAVNAALIETAGCSVHVPRHREGDVLERTLRIVARRGALRRESRDRRGRRDQIVHLAEQAVPLSRRSSMLWLKPRIASTPDSLPPPSAHFNDVGMDFGALIGRHRLDVAPRARAEERVEPLSIVARHQRRDRLDDRTLPVNLCAAASTAAFTSGSTGDADAGLQQQADPLALHVAGEIDPVDVLRPAGSCRRGHRAATAPTSSARCRRQCASSARRSAADIRRIDRHAPEARLEPDQAAPAGGQAHRAADVGADMQRAVTGRTRRARAGARSARILREVPGIARQRMEARHARTRSYRSPASWSWRR